MYKTTFESKVVLGPFRKCCESANLCGNYNLCNGSIGKAKAKNTINTVSNITDIKFNAT